MKNSVLNEMRVLINDNLNEEQREFFRETNRDKKQSEFYKIFEYIVHNDEYKIYQYESNNLRDHLYILKDKIIETFMKINELKHYKSLLKIETLFELKLIDDGLEKIQELLRNLHRDDYWIKWRLDDLLFKYLPLDERDLNDELFFNELKFLALQAINNNSINIDADKFLEKSPLVVWINNAKKEYEKKYKK
jgi:hypothetical protein